MTPSMQNPNQCFFILSPRNSALSLCFSAYQFDYAKVHEEDAALRGVLNDIFF